MAKKKDTSEADEGLGKGIGDLVEDNSTVEEPKVAAETDRKETLYETFDD